MCLRAATPGELLDNVVQAVARVVPHDGSTWFSVDPATLLAGPPSSSVNVDPQHWRTFWDNEFQQPDAALFRDLARSAAPAAGLRLATANRPQRSARYREYLHPQGYHDDLRAVFRTDESTWAAMCLYRQEGRASFSEGDVALLGAISSSVGAAYRTRAAPMRLSRGAETMPGVLVFDAEDVLRSSNAEASQWLGSPLQVGDRCVGWLEPLVLAGLLARARADAASPGAGSARVWVHEGDGRWVVLDATCLADEGGGRSVAVIVAPAKSADLAPIVMEMCGLSAKERDVVGAIASGLSTGAIAAHLFLSAHTVRAYIKSAFEKLGVTSRTEVVAKLFVDPIAGQPGKR